MNPQDNTPTETTPGGNDPRKTPVRTPASRPPTASLLAEARNERWHQDGKALLNQESVRDWIVRNGLVAYGQRALQLGAPAPSLLEAVQGSRLDPETAVPPEVAQSTRTLLTRLISEGVVVPLNLLGSAGGLATDTPDFVASAAVFSYIFTLRGAKAWKQPPATSGAVKVSPLALAVYEMLEAKVALSSAELATNLGKEVTESAILRALSELWSQLRVLPMPQLDGAPTQWELASARFTKQIKSGANAGQPSALSALITLYLGQALAATEEEIETFLSPLAPRSKVRDVLHALLPARQLETIVIDGKTLLHVAGELVAFGSDPLPAADNSEPPVASPDGAARIRKFAPQSPGRAGNNLGSGLRAKPSFKDRPRPAGKPGFAKSGGSFRARPSDDRERRPFRRDDNAPTRDKSTFAKPWQEDRKPRPSSRPSTNSDSGLSASASGEPARAPRRTFSKPGTFGRKREGSSSSFESPQRKTFDRGGSPPRSDFRGRAPRPEAADRPAGGGFKRETPREGGKPFSQPRPGGKPGGFQRDTPRAAGKPFSQARPGGKPGGFQRDRQESAASSEAPRKVFRKFDAPREGKPFRKRSPGDAPAGKPYAGRSGASPSGRPFAERPSRAPGASGFASRPSRPDAASGGKPFRPKSRPGGQSAFNARPSSGAKPGFGGKPKFAGKKPAIGGRPSSTGSGEGFKPVKRQRPEGNR